MRSDQDCRSRNVLNGLPEEQRHTTEIVQTRIGSTVLVDQPLPVAQRQHSCHRVTVLRSDAYTGILTDALDEVAEPHDRLRRDVVAQTSELEEAIQLLEKRLAPAHLIGKSFSFRPADLPLNAIFMKGA